MHVVWGNCFIGQHLVCQHCEKPFPHEDITLSISEDKA